MSYLLDEDMLNCLKNCHDNLNINEETWYTGLIFITEMVKDSYRIDVDS